MDTTSIPAGPVKFIINNTGGLEHEVVLERAGEVDEPFENGDKASEAEAIASSTSSTLEWTIDEPGQYQLACHVNKDGIDHYMLGMVQEFTVK